MSGISSLRSSSLFASLPVGTDGKLFVSGTYSLLSTAGSYGLGLVVLIAAQFVAIFLHELAHALTVKHYGREVRRAGVLIYFGMPAFFVDTTDMWLEGKRPRLYHCTDPPAPPLCADERMVQVVGRDETVPSTS